MVEMARSLRERAAAEVGKLCREIGARHGEVQKLEEKIAALARKSRARRSQLALELDEYRRGEFCSGCGKTRSQILSEGSTFPHSGQSIVRATAEQLAAKERSAAAELSRLSADQDAAAQRRDELVSENTQTLAQVKEGLNLWKSARTIELNALASEQAEKFAAEKKKTRELEAKLETITGEFDSEIGRTKPDLEVLGALASTWKLWDGVLKQVVSEGDAQYKAYLQDLTDTKKTQ